MAPKKQHGRRRAETAPRWNKTIQLQNAGTALATAGLLLTIATPAIAFGPPIENKPPTSFSKESSKEVVNAASNFLQMASKNAVIVADPNAKVSFEFATVTSVAGPETIKKAELQANAVKDAEAAKVAAEIAAAEAAAEAAKPAPVPAAGKASVNMPAEEKAAVATGPVSPTKLLSSPLANPVPTSSFGLRTSPITGATGEFHRGQDYGAACGTETLAAAGGTVVFSSWHQYGGGNRIEVDHGNGLITTYNHLASSVVKVGDKVERGQVIGLVGTTGASTGCHLHFEVEVNKKVVDPLAWL